MSCLMTFSVGQQKFLDLLKRQSAEIQTGCIMLLTVLFSVYLGLSVHRSVQDSIFLLVVTSLIVSGASYYLITLKYGERLVKWRHLVFSVRRKYYWKYIRWTLYGCITLAIGIFLSVDIARNNPRNLISTSGFIFFILISFFYSKSPAKISWRTVFCGTALQLTIGLVILRWQTGRDVIEWLAHYITSFVKFGTKGTRLLFGESYTEHSFAMEILPMFTWFNAVTSTLLYLGVMQFISKIIGGLLRFFVPGTSTAEAFVAAADIFLGPETSILMIRPMVCTLSDPELFTLLTCGLATIDVGLIPMFESFGVPAEHLLAASCMSAPAALMISKILFPNNNEDHNGNQKLKVEKLEAVNILDAFVKGAEASASYIAAIMAYLMTAVSLLEFVNTNLTWFGHRAGIEQLTLQLIMAYILTPVAFLMGVTWEDCHEVASLMGTKTIINEFVAYTELAELIYNRENGLEPSINPRSEVIAAYALCGFSNFGTVAILLGVMSSVIPNKIGCIAKMSMRSLFGGSMACFLTGCVAGILYKE